MAYTFIKTVILNESPNKTELQLVKLPYARGDLDPCISEDTINYHYGKLAKGYVDRYNNDEGDSDFNQAGAFLHNLLFPQYQSPIRNNTPTGPVFDFINEHYANFDEFKSTVEDVAMKVQGSGWVYLAKNGQIKTIKNHQLKSDIILLIDWWEHSYFVDYGPDKHEYLKNQWKIINWDFINTRIKL